MLRGIQALFRGLIYAVTLSLGAFLLGAPIPLAIAVGAFGTIVFSILDSLVRSATDATSRPASSGPDRWRAPKLIALATRLLLAVLVGSILATSIMLSLLASEIDSAMREARLTQAKMEVTQVSEFYLPSLESAREKLASVQAEIDTIQAQIVEERTGSGGSGTPGDGLEVEALRARLRLLESERESLSRDYLSQQERLSAVRTETVDQVVAQSPSALERLQAFGYLLGTSTSAYVMFCGLTVIMAGVSWSPRVLSRYVTREQAIRYGELEVLQGELFRLRLIADETDDIDQAQRLDAVVVDFATELKARQLRLQERSEATGEPISHA